VSRLISASGAVKRAVACRRSAIRSEPSMMLSRSEDHALATPSSTWRQLGMPWRGSGGKYVPA
jgi:hypothetical protein